MIFMSGVVVGFILAFTLSAIVSMSLVFMGVVTPEEDDCEQF